MVAVMGRSTGLSARFALTKFRPPTLPRTLVPRPALHEHLTAGASQRLTAVVGAAGAGKSVLLAEWMAARPPGLTSWLSCDGADADPARFWEGFIEALRQIEPAACGDAASLLRRSGRMSADVAASIANGAASLPAGSAIVVDDFHYASAVAAKHMTDLVERWPAGTVQLVLSSRSDPPVRLHRLRMWAGLCELRDRELFFSLPESRDLLAKFGVEISPADLALLHQRSEGWAAALQMAALSLRGTTDPARIARALEVRSHTIADYFISEVLDQQPTEVARFMLDTSALSELTADACAALTGRQDAAAMLHAIDTAHLFLVALDEDRTAFRYHRLVRQVLRAELRGRDEAREQALQLRAAEWYEVTGDIRRAARHFLAARQMDRALTPMQEQVMADFLHNPSEPVRLDLSLVDPARLAGNPNQLLALATDQLLWGDTARAGEYLDLLEHGQPPIPARSRLAARHATIRSLRSVQAGYPAKAVREGLAARAIQERRQLDDEWSVAIPLVLARAYSLLADLPAVTREAAAALAMAKVTEPVELVMIPGTLALAWFESGQLAKAADAATAAAGHARRLGFGPHLFALDHVRTLAGLALERRDLGTAESLTEQVLAVARRRWPAFEFLALLDRAQILAARRQSRDALAVIEGARRTLAGPGSVLLDRADELEALTRLSLGDLRSPAMLASRLPAARRDLLLARIALTAGDHHTAHGYLWSGDELTPRHALVRRLLLAATAIERGDPAAASILGSALHTARDQGFLNTVVTTAPQVSRYLIEHARQLGEDPFTRELTAAARHARASQAGASQPCPVLAEPLTAAEERILRLLPESTYLQLADALYISRNTVKTHLRSIYQKLGATSRAQALERAADLRLI
ncbi:MAG TPA: LuxR C-terminal-related transcriptional regulator [Streptosporangiaceae bacterium]|jgi:LuxR family maltose regulon positive regulatory protein